MINGWSLPHPLARIVALGSKRARDTARAVAGSPPAPGRPDFLSAFRVAMWYWAVVFVLDVINDGPIRALDLGWPGLGRVLFESSVWWSLWLLATPALVLLLRRLSPTGVGWRWWTAAHVATGSALCLAHVYATCWMFYWLAPGTPPPDQLVFNFMRQFMLPEILCYWGLVAVVQLTWSHRKDRALSLEVASLRQRTMHLEEEHRRARLTNLHRELDEHFVLNALHGVGGLVRTGLRDRAVGMLERIGSVMRASAEVADLPEVRLDRELDLLSLYLRIEEARGPWGGPSVRYDVPESVHGAAVPPFLLQPLVENALRHGRAPGASRLLIRGRRVGARVRIEVQDHGGRPEPVRRMGTGLATTLARLRLLHGGAADLELQPTGDGMLAQATLPFRPLTRSE